MTDETKQVQVEDILADPIDSVLYHVGRGIAQSQMEMDKSSLATQILIDNDEELSDWGIQATWYHFSEVNVEISMALSMHGLVQKKEGKIQAVRFKMFSAPMNATYSSTFDFDVSGRSTVKAKIVSIPPPAGVKGT